MAAVLKFLLLFVGWTVCILLVLLILVLFVPIRYRVKAAVEDEGSKEEPDFSKLKEAASCRAQLSLLFGAVRCSLDVPQDEEGPVIYVLCIPIRPMKILKGKKARREKKPDNEAQHQLDRDMQEKAGKTPAKPAQGAAKAQGTAPAGEPAPAQKPASAQKPAPAQKPVSVQKPAPAHKPASGKADAVIRILKLLRDPELERARSIVLKQVIRVLRMLLPKKWSADADIGLGNPYDTARVLEAAGIMYPLLQGHVRIAPEFEIYRFNTALDASGRLYLFMAVFAALTVLLDRDTLRLRNELKKHRGQRHGG